VAVGALNDGVSPKLAEAIERQHLVDHSRAKQDTTCVHGVCPSGDVKSTSGSGDAADENVLHDDAGILAQLLSSEAPELIRSHSVARDEVVHVHRGRVSARA
jgi:hypothetical protein